jgi:adenosylhomocysteine nucleosidase
LSISAHAPGSRDKSGEFEVVLADRTVVYDIAERMGGASEAIVSYSTAIDLDWLRTQPLPSPVRRSVLVSGDRDLAPADVPVLRRLYRAIAVDWESGAIARVASRNYTRVLILRGVSDLVGEAVDSETYGQPELFDEPARTVMRHLFGVRPAWLNAALPLHVSGSRTPINSE